MTNETDLELDMKQTDFAALVGISQQAVSDLVKRGIIKGGSPKEWIRHYCEHLREVAAGRGSDSEDSLDLVAERARLAAAQADLKEMQVAERRRELANVSDMEWILSAVGGVFGGLLDNVPVIIRRHLPDLPAALTATVDDEIAKARNQLARLTLASLTLASTDGNEEGDE